MILTMYFKGLWESRPVNRAIYCCLCREMCGALLEQTWWRSTRWCYIPNIKALGHMFQTRIFFHVAIFGPRSIIWTNLVEFHKVMLDTKYRGSRPYDFREDFMVSAEQSKNLSNAPYVNSKSTDQTMHPSSLISSIIVCCLDSIYM